MRLIDVDEFKNVLNSGGGETTNINISKSMPLGEIVDIVIQAYRKCLFAELDKMPTAYDVDKVVEQIWDMRFDFQEVSSDKNKVLKIVKEGGVNEKLVN